ncbi:MAG: ABC transporter permease [Anaerolineae bacterium]|nr:ABC transporter permease [Anaerolineae bacterium]
MTTPLLTSNRQIVARPNLWSQFLGEVFKWRRHRLYQWFIAAPFLLAVVMAFGLAVGTRGRSLPDIDNNTMMTFGPATYNLGTTGAFATAGQFYMTSFLAILSVGFALVAGWCVHSEFNWRTIKMVASRQPSRVQIVLSKVLFVAALAFASFIMLTLGWFFLSIVFKLVYRAPLGITANDVDAISLGINHLILRCLAMFMWALPTMAAVYSSKSVTGGVLLYFVYSGTEAFLSNLGAAAINNPLAYSGAEGFFQTILEVAKTAYPYLLTSHLNRITMVSSSPQVVATMPLAVSWLAVGIYLVLYIAITLWIFVPRDIKE